MRKRDTCRLSLQVTKGSVATGVQVLGRVRSYEWVLLVMVQLHSSRGYGSLAGRLEGPRPTSRETEREKEADRARNAADGESRGSG